MLINPYESFMSAAIPEELQKLYEEMLKYCDEYGPKKEDLEEDDEASIILDDISLLNPHDKSSCIEAIRLLHYFLYEYSWHEDNAIEEKIEALLSKAKEILPQEKRQRRTMRRWIMRLDSRKL
ncbi:D-aminoacyl-tRNA deacylase [Planomicrobium sp. CPCC 101110]|uniref:D-aminoacyl-tRNA deacylase n=1 Tax=Planomicrobium sp. CPCC 101110 TaxID=2599619 RepID=UPI0011B5B3AA|nr:D-aminoacyl-tRNA deacylase [Planomicrobium sp. CPCC 101110]TWT25129.1 D-aminoacyl-tRNA deacylase [Planomicrobium sp. CPCC 101110]